MATVTYLCNFCDYIWYVGSGWACPDCGCKSVLTEWDEQDIGPIDDASDVSVDSHID